MGHLSVRYLVLGLITLLMAACAHEPVAPPPGTRAPIERPAPPVETAPAAPADTNAPAVAMPSEWQHHNGEDYDDLFDRMRAGFVLDEAQEPAIDQQLAWFQRNPEFLDRTLARAQRYLYHIVTEVEARGMPLEFALLPVVESAYEPFAYSPSRAAGLWQFIPGTGVRFGLKQDWWYDGRRDVIESTRAALDYLQALHDQFDGDWLLAIAAYNVGENTVQREFDRNKALGKPADFWHLNLPAETRAYVPKLLAMKRLMAEPERYGLDFAPLPNQPYFAVIDVDSQIDLQIAAHLAGSPYDEIVALNPGYNRWATDPDGPHRLLVPIDNADGFETALKSLAPEERVHYLSHTVARHETLAQIAKHYGTTSSVLTKINDLAAKPITAGDELRIPPASDQLPEKVLLAAARVDRPSSDNGRRQRQTVHRVRAGETLASIARRQGIPVGTLAQLNNLNPGDPIVTGQRVVIRAGVRRYRDEGVSEGKRVLYTVRKGDTVLSIAHQYQVTIAQLNTWNGLNKHHQIRTGQRLVMYIDQNRSHS